ncbi:uncharacterized protein LOC116292193 [Actinia tenebrosa]|uniref:Uncharacterized protein LOC116292193 n=1 Tax=Actinia tenebrosa TaxID=6105 RepID=A0A6P8HHK1_ACTTE|nr:uncharacterized protein LOC116292193 [Actinia tenebrosa]
MKGRKLWEFEDIFAEVCSNGAWKSFENVAGERCYAVPRSLTYTEGDNATFSELSNASEIISRFEFGVWLNSSNWNPCVVIEDTKVLKKPFDKAALCKPFFSRLKFPTKENLEQGKSATVLQDISLNDEKIYYTAVCLEGKYENEDPVIQELKVLPRQVTVNTPKSTTVTAKTNRPTTVTTKPNSAAAKSEYQTILFSVCFALLMTLTSI